MCASPPSPRHAQPDWMGGGLVSRQMTQAPAPVAISVHGGDEGAAGDGPKEATADLTTRQPCDAPTHPDWLRREGRRGRNAHRADALSLARGEALVQTSDFAFRARCNDDGSTVV